jgi:hypothetical protein
VRLLETCRRRSPPYLDLTARENLEFWSRMYDLSGNVLRENIDAALEAVGIIPRADDIVGTFSDGLQQRLKLACGIMCTALKKQRDLCREFNEFLSHSKRLLAVSGLPRRGLAAYPAL